MSDKPEQPLPVELTTAQTIRDFLQRNLPDCNGYYGKIDAAVAVTIANLIRDTRAVPSADTLRDKCEALIARYDNPPCQWAIPCKHLRAALPPHSPRREDKGT